MYFSVNHGSSRYFRVNFLPSLDILLKKCSELSELSIETLISVEGDQGPVKGEQGILLDDRSLRTHFTIFTDEKYLLISLLFLFLLLSPKGLVKINKICSFVKINR
jgi:hypothetical protein